MVNYGNGRLSLQSIHHICLDFSFHHHQLAQLLKQNNTAREITLETNNSLCLSMFVKIDEG